MGESISTLRIRIEQTQRSLVLARQAGHPYEAHLHRRHLENLIDSAAERGVDVDPWLDQEILAVHEEL